MRSLGLRRFAFTLTATIFMLGSSSKLARLVIKLNIETQVKRPNLFKVLEIKRLAKKRPIVRLNEAFFSFLINSFI